jgi:hypothetical protein
LVELAGTAQQQKAPQGGLSLSRTLVLVLLIAHNGLTRIMAAEYSAQIRR